MMQQYTIKQRRMLALGLLLAAIVMMILLLQPLFTLYSDNNRQIEQMLDHIGRFHHLQSVAEDNQQLLDEWQAYGPVQQYLLTGGTTGLASAGLQKLVKDIIQQAGGQLLSTSTISYQSKDYLQAVGVRVKLQGDVRAMQRILHELESHVPLLRIDALSINHMNPRRSRVRRIRTAQTDGTVEMRFTISGYMQAKDESP